VVGRDRCLLRQTSGVSRPELSSGSTYRSAPESFAEREGRLWPKASRVEPLKFSRVPLLAAALCFALGDSIPKLTPEGSVGARPTVLLVAAVAAVIALALLAFLRAPRMALVPVAALWLAAGLWSAQVEPAPSPQAALLGYADGLSRTVQARVTRLRELPPRASSAEAEPSADQDPDQWDDPGTPALTLDLAPTAIEDLTPDLSRMVHVAGGIRANLLANPAQHLPQLHCGDLIEAPIRLRVPERFRDPNAWQYADYLLDQGVAATASLPAAKLRILPADRSTQFSAAFDCRIFAAQTWASARLLAFTRSTPNRHLPALLRLTPDDAGMLNAMLFGDRSRLTHALRLGFERTGSFHLFVVCGMHVALLAGGLLWLTRRLRLRPSVATAIVLALTTAYALLTGFGVPVQRALLMTAVYLLARILFRERNPLNALGAAALAVLIESPRALFEASFQMTFLAIVAIAGIAIPLGERSFLPYAYAAGGLGQRWKDTSLPPRFAQFRVMLRLWSDALAGLLGPSARGLPCVLILASLYAAELALIGLIAEAVMVLPMALYFHRATVFALPANMISIPLVGLLAPLGVATFCATLLPPPAGSWLACIPAAATALLLHAITYAISLVSRHPSADLRVPGPVLARSLLAAACFGLCCWAVRRSRRYALTAVAILPLAAAVVLWPSPPRVYPNQLEVTAIDVGQGDSLLVVGPSGRAMLIDAGGPTGAAANAENASGSASFDVGEEVVSPYLWSRQIRRLDVIALTHAHSDHIGGMPAALRNFRPRELWVAVDSTAPAFRALLAEAAALNIPVRHLRAGDTLPWDSTTISVLAPAPTYTNLGPPVNNDSLVLRVQFDQSSALLEGDAEAASEHAMVARATTPGLANNNPARIGPDTLLKVAHHGSRTSSTPEFIALAAPQVAIVSVGRQNTFGHPRPEVIARLAAAHARVYRTDQFGLTTFLLSRDGRISTIPFASNP
jgi:competence protein ComEC